MVYMKPRAFLVTAVLLLTSAALAQLKVDVALVTVVATVTDDRGRYVEDLKPEDFIVQEDGVTQTISHLSQSNDLPVSVGITLDTSGSMERKITTATNAVERFVRSIHEDDDIFLMTFSNRPVLAQDFTDDRSKLSRALQRVRVGGDTALYDALDDSLRKMKSGKHTKKAVLLITDGEDTSSYSTFDDARLAVRESELLVYGIGISPGSGGPLSERAPGGSTPPATGGRRRPGQIPTFPFPFPRIPGLPLAQIPRGQRQSSIDSVDMNVLNAFADTSGGKAWLLSGDWSEGRINQIDRIMDEIAAELRNQYSIGYYPQHSFADGKWHRIEVRMKNSKYNVRTRKEYFGG
jgi:Ca-activated chloride channel family protein